MARLVLLLLLGLLLVAGFGAAVEEEAASTTTTTMATTAGLRVSLVVCDYPSGPSQTSLSPSRPCSNNTNVTTSQGAATPAQGRECPPGRCPRITCIREVEMAQKKCGMPSSMCPAGFCAAVGACVPCVQEREGMGDSTGDGTGYNTHGVDRDRPFAHRTPLSPTTNPIHPRMQAIAPRAPAGCFSRTTTTTRGPFCQLDDGGAC